MTAFLSVDVPFVRVLGVLRKSLGAAPFQKRVEGLGRNTQGVEFGVASHGGHICIYMFVCVYVCVGCVCRVRVYGVLSW